jgi:hypothetical protein
MFFFWAGSATLELNACLFTELLLVMNGIEEGNETVIVVGSSSSRRCSSHNTGISRLLSLGDGRFRSMRTTKAT